MLSISRHGIEMEWDGIDEFYCSLQTDSKTKILERWKLPHKMLPEGSNSEGGNQDISQTDQR